VDVPGLILASASPRRAALLEAYGVPFETAPADVDETPREGESAEALVDRLAEAKARVVAALKTRGVVLGADTAVAIGDVQLGKPEDAEDARRMLRLLSGTRHRVVTGYCAIDATSGFAKKGAATTFVSMRPLTDRDVEDYVASGECFGKAGAYAIQETADRFVASVEGPFDNVVGLPTEAALAAVAAALLSSTRAERSST
jgi:septum formation protein